MEEYKEKEIFPPYKISISFCKALLIPLTHIDSNKESTNSNKPECKLQDSVYYLQTWALITFACMNLKEAFLAQPLKTLLGSHRFESAVFPPCRMGAPINLLCYDQV